MDTRQKYRVKKLFLDGFLKGMEVWDSHYTFIPKVGKVYRSCVGTSNYKVLAVKKVS